MAQAKGVFVCCFVASACLLTKLLSACPNQFSGSHNALQTSLKKRFSRGTHQKTNRRSDWSRSSWDINHVLVFSYVYELPFGRGRQFGGNMSRLADTLVGGWSLEGIARLESGPPFMVFTSEDIANTGRKTQRINVLSNPNEGVPRTPDAWFNRFAFVRPAHFNFGNASPYITNADGIIGLDFSLQKAFAITERHQLEFRGEGQRVASRQIQFSLRYRF